MNTSDEHGRRPGEDWEGQLTRHVGDLRRCVQEDKLRINAVESNIRQLQDRREADQRFAEQEKAQTADWRRSVVVRLEKLEDRITNKVDAIDSKVEALAIAIARHDGERKDWERHNGGAPPAPFPVMLLIQMFVGVGAAVGMVIGIVGWVVLKVFGFGAPS